MPAIPLPFITALLLLIIVVKGVKKSRFSVGTSTFMCACIIMMLLAGLRWSSQFNLIAYLQPVLASMIPAVAWCCFTVHHKPSHRLFIPLLFAAPLVTAVLMAYPLVWFSVDGFITLLFAGHGMALLWPVIKSSGIALTSCQKQVESNIKAAAIVGAGLCFSSVTDLFIAIDFAYFAGHHAAAIVAAGHTVLLIALAFAITDVTQKEQTKSDRLLTEVEPEYVESVYSEAEQLEDKTICQQIAQLLAEKPLYTDPDLTLSSLARKLLIPGRKISRAINRIEGKNFSQMINSYRIAKAKHLLLNSSLTVTEIMLESGFRTKSNFNREFLRVSKMNPGEFRKRGDFTSVGNISTHSALDLKNE
ncbi:helix-turn-helix domain-containing protein [Duffyella gerundensis]|uniref:helix-turn-helix domain-containing protein n=1 Tax=Duffyella TaxID=3026546 RepID=UPI003F6DD345